MIDPNMPGDFNASAQLDAADIDALSSAIRIELLDAALDLDGDGQVAESDRMVWVHELAQTHFGDADLDGSIGFAFGDCSDSGYVKNNLSGKTTLWRRG